MLNEYERDHTLNAYIRRAERERLEEAAIGAAMSKPYDKAHLYRTNAIMDEGGGQIGEVNSDEFDASQGTLGLDWFHKNASHGPAFMKGSSHDHCQDSCG